MGNEVSPSCRKTKSLLIKFYRKSQDIGLPPKLKVARKSGIEKRQKRTRLDCNKSKLGDSWLRFVNVNPKLTSYEI